MLRLLLATVLTVLLCGTALHAQNDDFSPWEAWRKGYSFYEEGEKFKKQNDSKKALEAFLNARDCYRAVQKARPEWQQSVIEGRINRCNREIKELRDQIDQTAAAKQALPPPLQEKGDSTTSKEIVASHGNTYELNQKLEKYQKEFSRIRAENEVMKKEIERNKSTQLEVANLVKEKTALELRITNLQNKIELQNQKQDEPAKELKDLQQRLVEERMKLDIANQRLKMQDSEADKQKKEIADLLKSRNEAREKTAEAEKAAAQFERQLSDNNKLNQTRIKLLTELEKKNEELAKERDIQDVRVKNQQAEIERLTKLASAGDKTHAQQLTDNRDLAKKLTDASVENERLTKEAAELRKQDKELMSEVKELKAAIVALTDQRDKFAKDQKALADQVKKAAELSALQQKEIADLTKKNIEISEERKAYIDKYDKAQQRLETRLTSEYENVLALSKQVTEGKEKLKTGEENLKKVREELAKSQESIKKQADTIQELNDKLTTRDDAGKQLLNVSGDLSKLQEEHKKLQETLAKLDKENRENAAVAAKYETAAKQLKELSASKAELDVLKVKHQQTLEVVEELKKSQTAVKPATVTAPADNKKLAEYEKKIAEAEKKLAESDNLLKNFREQLKETAEQQKKLTRQLAEANDKITADDARLTAAADKLAAADKQAQEDRNSLKEMAMLKKQLSALQDSLNTKDDADSKDNPWTQAERNLAVLEKASLERTRIIASLQSKIGDNKEADATFKQLEGEIEKNTKLIASLRSQFAELNKLHQQDLDDKTKISALVKIHEEKEINNQTEIARLSEILKAAEKKTTTTDKQKLELADAREQLNKQLADNQEQLKKLREESTANGKIIDELRKTLAEAEKNLKDKSVAAGSDNLLQRQLTAASEIYRRQLGERDTKITQLEQQMAMNTTTRKQLQRDLEDAKKQLSVLEATRRSEMAAIDNFNRTFSADLAKAMDNKPQMAPEEISLHSAELLSVGQSAEKEDEPDVAMWNYRKILEFDPENFQANARLGSICLKKGMYKEAAAHFSTAMKKDSTNPQVNLEYSLCLFEIKDYLTAEKILAGAVKNDSRNDDLRSAWALAMTNLGQTTEAEKELRSILKRTPGRVDAMVYLAETLAESGRRDEALDLYRQARKLGAAPVPRLEKLSGKNNDNEDAKQFLYQSAAEAEKKNDTISAIWYYAQIRKLEGDGSAVANRLALMQLENDKAEDALMNIRNRQDDPESQLLAGLACAMQEKYLDAAAYFRISGRLKNGSSYQYPAGVLRVAEKVHATMSALAARGSNQSLEAAREALQNTIK